MNKNIIIGAIVGILVIGGGSFYAGTKYSGGSNSGRPIMGQDGQFRMSQNGQGFGGARMGQGMGGSITAGVILSKDAASITVKLQDGGSKIVFLTASTTITKSSVGSVNDLAVSENVIVNGAANSDESINAESIQLGGVMRFGQIPNQQPQ
jgi:hypothetical protein